MLSLILQFVGAILLSWNQITKKRDDLVMEGKTFVNTSKNLSKDKGRKVLKNYYFNLLGFVSIAIGYLCQILKLDVLQLNELNACCIVLIVMMIVVVVYIVILLIVQARTKDLIEHSTKMGPQEGEIIIDDSSKGKFS